MDVKKTITSIFIVPTVKIPKGKLKENGFINGYIKDSGHDIQYEDCVYILFKPDNLDLFREFLDAEYERTKDIVDDYDYEDGYIVIIYKLKSKFKKDYELIKKGMYSKTSKSFQNEFTKVVNIIKDGKHLDELSLQVRVFKKSPDIKEYWEEKLDITFTDDMEFWEGFHEENETLEIDKIKNYVQSGVS